MTIPEKLRMLADMAEHNPADMISAHDGGVTIVVTNFVTAARWRVQLENHPELDADVRLLQPVAVPA